MLIFNFSKFKIKTLFKVDVYKKNREKPFLFSFSKHMCFFILKFKNRNCFQIFVLNGLNGVFDESVMFEIILSISLIFERNSTGKLF